MKTLLLFALSSCFLCSAISAKTGDDLSSYRNFKFGMSTGSVLKQTEISPAQTKVIYKVPALIEEIAWNPQRYTATSDEIDPVKEIRFRFYKGDLFQMAVTYDPYKTEGLTVDDLIESISKTNNLPVVRMDTDITFPATYNESAKIIARWENAQSSFNLVVLDYQKSFALLIFSKKTEALARESSARSIAMEKEEAPQKEIDLQIKQEQEKQVQLEKARQLNKPGFRP